jgi:hypothetical protein
VRLPVFDERGGAFARLRNRRVLLYWPHGLGDLVHLGYVAPLLDPTNTYFITRFGDDFVHLYDGCENVTPLYSGVRAIDDGGSLGARHLGIDFKKIRNREMTLVVPEPLRARIAEARIDAVLYTDYPEREGKTAFPFQTKARALAQELVSRERLAESGLDAPLRSALTLAAPADVTALVEERLRTFVAPEERLIVLSPGGHSALRKVWPEAEVQSFAEHMRARDSRNRVLTIDERSAAESGRDRELAPTTHDLFAGIEAPFAHVLLALIRASDAFAGVPSGPLHAALAAGGRPVVGIWLAHHPDWYDEPCRESIHLVGPYVYAKRFERRNATITRPERFHTRVVPFPHRTPQASDVAQAFELLG